MTHYKRDGLQQTLSFLLLPEDVSATENLIQLLFDANPSRKDLPQLLEA